jgi:hypothetical protein
VKRALALAVALAACGGGSAEIGPRPSSVASELAPAAVSEGLKLYESTGDEVVDAFANAGEESLVADGRLWEIRKGARLVGALQIATVKTKVDLADARRRDSIVAEVLIGTSDRIRVGDVEVYASAANDKVVYLWFGESLFEVLQLKGDELDHERVLADVIEHQDGLEAWRPLAVDVEAEVEDEDEAETSE